MHPTGPTITPPPPMSLRDGQADGRRSLHLEGLVDHVLIETRQVDYWSPRVVLLWDKEKATVETQGLGVENPFYRSFSGLETE